VQRLLAAMRQCGGGAEENERIAAQMHISHNRPTTSSLTCSCVIPFFQICKNSAVDVAGGSQASRISSSSCADILGRGRRW